MSSRSGPIVFVDTNVMLYAFDSTNSAKQNRSRSWLSLCWTERCGRISTQVLSEFYVNVRKKFRSTLPLGDLRAEVRRYQQWSPWSIDQATIESAWEVESRYRINYWDALMVAAAQHQGCSLMLTEDLQHEQRIGGVRIVDPFTTGPESLGAIA